MHNFRLDLRVTPSGYQNLLCLKRAYTIFAEKRRFPSTFSPSLAFGTAVHEILRHVYASELSVRPVDADIERLAERAFRFPEQTVYTYSREDMLNSDMQRGVKMVRAYIAQQEAVDLTRTFRTEEFKTVPIYRKGKVVCVLSCKFDRLFVHRDAPRSLVIRDYKTGTAGREDLIPATIMLAIARHHWDKIYDDFRVEFDYLDDEMGLALRRTIMLPDCQLGWPKLASSIERVLLAEEYPAEPGELCRFCPINQECQPETNMGVSLDSLQDLF